MIMNIIMIIIMVISTGEANQKGWCDKALSDATQKRDYAAEEVMTLNILCCCILTLE